MSPPAAFVEPDLAALDALVERDAFITLVTAPAGRPQATHLPVLYRRDGARVELRGHFARANPQACAAAHALAIVHGPHAYVSPSWYPDKDARTRVPTWNYAVAHIEGPLEVYEDEDRLGELVAALSARHEARVGGDWRYEHAREDQRVQLRGIVGFTLVAERVQPRFKLGQNHPPANRLAVADRFDALDSGHGPELARLMRERTPT